MKNFNKNLFWILALSLNVATMQYAMEEEELTLEEKEELKEPRSREEIMQDLNETFRTLRAELQEAGIKLSGKKSGRELIEEARDLIRAQTDDKKEQLIREFVEKNKRKPTFGEEFKMLLDSGVSGRSIELMDASRALRKIELLLRELRRVSPGRAEEIIQEMTK